MRRPTPVPPFPRLLLRLLVPLSFGLLILATCLHFSAERVADLPSEVTVLESSGAEAVTDEDRTPAHLLIAWLLAATGAVLLVGDQGDDRARWFGRFLVFGATAFCYVPLASYLAREGSLVRTLPLHLAIMTVAPYCFWRLAAEFPHSVDRAAIRRTLQFGTTVAWVFAWAGLLANLALWLGFAPATVLDHGPQDGLVQFLYIALNAVALLVVAIRWLTASQRDRRRSGPFLAILGLLALMNFTVIAANALQAPLGQSTATFGATVVALLLFLGIAIRQRGLHVRVLGARPLLRRIVEWATWAALAVPPVYFWLRWSDTEPSLDLQLLFVLALVAVFIASRPRRQGSKAQEGMVPSALVGDAPKLTSTRQRDEWLDRLQQWSGADRARLVAVHPEQAGTLLDPPPKHCASLHSLIYIRRRTLDLDHLDALEFGELEPETRDWIAEEQLSLVEPILSSTDHILGLLMLSRPEHETAHRSDTVALLPVVAAGLATAIGRLPAQADRGNREQSESTFAAAFCPRCQSVFSALVVECPACRRDLVTLKHPLLIADKYQLEKRIGRGSWGAVFQARDLLLERPVALKFFHLGGEAGAKGVLREARALVSLRGPQLTEIYGAEEHDSGLVLITELLDGGVLADRMRPGEPTLGLRQAIEFGVELLQCLEPLHDRDLVHGDIKPSNLGFDRGGRLKLIDFGMVRALQDGALPSTPSSGGLGESTLLPGGQPGTPIYSPPEAWQAEAVGVAGDLWPVAVVLWELLTGQHPFSRPGDDLHLLGERIRRSQTNPWPDNVDQPPRLKAFFQRALHIDPGRRYVDLPALERALRTLLQSS